MLHSYKRNIHIVFVCTLLGARVIVLRVAMALWRAAKEIYIVFY
jgi:hypothetical protein